MELTANDVSLFNSGDPNAFEKIFHTLYKSVYYFSKDLLGNADDAEDITQETFVKLWNLQGHFNTTLNIRAFLMITVRNASLNYLRNKDRANEVLKDTEDMDAAVGNEDFEEEERKAVRAMAQAKTLEVLTQIIAELPAAKREVLQLFYFDGLSKKEISDRYGITPTAVKKRIDRALNLLRIKLLQRKIVLVLMLVISYPFVTVIKILKKVFH
jgi:RNA polymerase sigma-70 factor (family 1)